MPDATEAAIDRSEKISSLCETFTKVARHHIKYLWTNTAAKVTLALTTPALPLVMLYGGLTTFGITAGVGLAGLAVMFASKAKVKSTRATMDDLNKQIDTLKKADAAAKKPAPSPSA